MRVRRPDARRHPPIANRRTRTSMRDISARIQRYRLSRYAPPVDRVRRRLRWAWVFGGFWLVWVGLFSEHNFYRLWQLGREDALNRQDFQHLSIEADRLDRESRDPKIRRRAAEAYLREQAGMARKD